jgi:hypothetical protein
MSTSNPNRFLQRTLNMAAGITGVVLVVGGALYLGSSHDSGAEAPPPLAPRSVLSRPSVAPTFKVETYSAKLGKDGIAPGEPGEEPSEDEGPIRGVTGPSDLMLQMATRPSVTPSSSRPTVEAFVRDLLVPAERCWSAAAGDRRGGWHLVLRMTASGLDTSNTRLRRVQDYDLERCLDAALKSADASGFPVGLKAYWPVVLDPSDGVQMD